MTLPDGYHARPFRLEDAAELVSFLNDYWRFHTGAGRVHLDEQMTVWQTRGFDPAVDALVVTGADGKIAGYADLWDVREPYVRKRINWIVHPEHIRLGVGVYLLDWVVERARQNQHKAPPGTRVGAGLAVTSSDLDSQDLLREKGFQQVRQFQTMRIRMDALPPAPGLPEGIHIRSFRPGDLDRLVRTQQEVFRDHWGSVEESHEQALQRARLAIRNDPDHNPRLWFLAWAGDAIAGFSLCKSRAVGEDAVEGWVDTLGVRREWRSRGLGLALLQHSFIELFRRGITQVSLWVDSNNLTGATRLYEKAGMSATRRENTYEIVLREGVDLSTQRVE